jgi:hypothetical protein
MSFLYCVRLVSTLLLLLPPQSHIDDEYASAAISDPKVCVTTSREPSSRLKQFAKVSSTRWSLDVFP